MERYNHKPYATPFERLKCDLDAAKAKLILETLGRHQGNYGAAAEELRRERSNLYRDVRSLKKRFEWFKAGIDQINRNRQSR